MKNKVKHIMCGILTISIVLSTSIFALTADTKEPASSADPLVSKSYVDEQISQLLTALNTNNGTNIGVNSSILGTSDVFTPVEVLSGQKILGHEGTEIILRSGQAIGYCPGENGITNVTTGSEIFNGKVISKNNLLIIPREDGRGVSVISDAWFLVKGGYDIE